MTMLHSRPRSPLSPLISDVFERSALLIAERGWCQGRGLQFLGSPGQPQAASLTAALLWAATGHAATHNLTSRRALAALRDHVDPGRTAPFDDWELLCAWNDSPSRTRSQTVALLSAARRHSSQLPVSRAV